MDTSLIRARHQRLDNLIEQAGFDALIVNPGPTLGYLSGLGFHLSERPVVMIFRPGHQPVIILPELEAAKLDAVEYELTHYLYGEDVSTWAGVFAEGVRAAGLNGKRIGVEPRVLRFLELRLLEKAAPEARFEDAEAVIAAMRMYKDEAEIASIRRAVHVAQDAVSAAVEEIREGMTEKDVASELIRHMLRLGSSAELPFDPIVAFGAESANPHASPGDRTLEQNQLVLIDWGANIDGYMSDLTRVYAFGEVSGELADIATIVAEANAAGRAVAGPGVAVGDVDAATRGVIERAGYGECFIHRTGHGLGLESHEEPYIRAGNDMKLEPGMVFTIEPGIYLRGRGGVRIEDDVVITADGAESLSDAPREMLQIGR